MSDRPLAHQEFFSVSREGGERSEILVFGGVRLCGLISHFIVCLFVFIYNYHISE